jgi:RimJ/RimL family protein N-acetyltransferase
LYSALLFCGFKEEARLKEHCFFEGQFLDVVYHAKMNRNLTYRKSTENDIMLYFDWANEESVRSSSYNSEPIPLASHQQWFLNKIKDPNSFMMVFENHIGDPVGQVRIEKNESNNALIGISNDARYRGKGYAVTMIQMASDTFLAENPETSISAFIKIENKASEKAFAKAGYILEGITEYESIPSYHYIKKL